MKRSALKPPYRVAMTGATGDLGALLLPLLEADPRVERVLAVGVAAPSNGGPKVGFRRLDLTQPNARAELVDVLREERIDALYHLAFLLGKIHRAAFAHELEVAGSMHVLGAAAETRLRKLIVPSLTALYGARPQHPAQLREEAPLHGCPGSRFIADKVAVELQIQEFSARHPETAVTVLRFAPVVGPTIDNPMTRWLRTRVVPVLLGYDPPWQVVHEQDAVAALHRALFADVRGAVNVVGRGLSSLSALVRGSGGVAVPLPAPLVKTVVRLFETFGVAAVPTPLLDYLRYGWVADGSRSSDALGMDISRSASEAIATLRGG